MLTLKGFHLVLMTVFTVFCFVNPVIDLHYLRLKVGRRTRFGSSQFLNDDFRVCEHMRHRVPDSIIQFGHPDVPLTA